MLGNLAREAVYKRGVVSGVSHHEGMNLLEELQNSGGAMRTAELHQRGHSEYVLARAVRQRRVQRPRRGWIAVNDLDVEALTALRHGAVLGCASLAVRLRLWVQQPPTVPHLAMRSCGSHGPPADSARLHWAKPVQPRAPKIYLDSVPNMLQLVAHCQEFEPAVAIWDSALNKRLIDLPSLQKLELSAASQRVLACCDPYAESGLESLFRVRLRWLQVPIRSQIWLCGHRVDFLLGAKLVVQLDGKQHNAQRSADYRHDVELQLHGYHVLRFDYAQIVHEWPAVQERVQLAVAVGLHREGRGEKGGARR